MSKNNSKSLATLRQKLRKYNKDFEADILNYRANPEAEDDEKEDEEEPGKYILLKTREFFVMVILFCE